MKRSILIASIFFSGLSTLSAFDFYKKTIEIEFESESDAKQVQITPMRFPENKKYAFSNRWDDSNKRNINMQQMLQSNGLNGTYYLNDNPKSSHNTLSVGKKLLEMGAAIGSHSVSHPYLPRIGASSIFREILMQRIYLESTFDTPVVSFALPNTAYKFPFDERVAEIIGQSIVSSGYLIMPERPPYLCPYNFEITGCNLPESSIIISPAICANDRNPNEDEFKQQMQTTIAHKDFQKKHHFTLGIHAWQTDEGLDRLGKIINTYITNDYWRCTANELVSYIILRDNVRIKKESVREKTATFEITLVSARDLGCDIALYLNLSIPDKNGNTSVKVKQNQTKTTAKKIEHLTSDLSQKEIESKKFSGITVQLSLTNDNALNASISSNKPLSDIRIKFILPPVFSLSDIDSKAIAKIDADKTIKATAKLLSNKRYEDLFFGNIPVATQIDFILEGKPSRIYVSAEIAKDNPQVDFARDKALISELADCNDFTEDKVLKLAKKDAILVNPKSSDGFSNWRKNTNREISKHCIYTRPKGKYTWQDFISPKYLCLAAFDVVAPRKDEYQFTTISRFIRNVFVNGKKLDDFKKLPLDKGKNRVIVSYGKKGFPPSLFTLLLMVSDNDGKPLKMQTPEIQKSNY